MSARERGFRGTELITRTEVIMESNSKLELSPRSKKGRHRFLSAMIHLLAEAPVL
jgi:hypothetical protein